MKVCRPGLEIVTLFQTKKLPFFTAVSDLASKIHTRFKTWPLLVRNYVIITQITTAIKKKTFLQMDFEFAFFSFFPIHLDLKQ